jgi:hypothetical protein
MVGYTIARRHVSEKLSESIISRRAILTGSAAMFIFPGTANLQIGVSFVWAAAAVNPLAAQG